MSSMSSPSVNRKGLGWIPMVLASSVFTTASSSKPFTNAFSMRLFTGRYLQDTFLAPAGAAPASCKTQRECSSLQSLLFSRPLNLIDGARVSKRFYSNLTSLDLIYWMLSYPTCYKVSSQSLRRFDPRTRFVFPPNNNRAAGFSLLHIFCWYNWTWSSGLEAIGVPAISFLSC